jgi:hypothetical protein
MAALALTAVLSMSTAHTPPVAVPKTADSQMGIEDSAYTGDYYLAVQEPYRKCVAYHEGRGRYWGTSSMGKYMGTYQFTAGLARGAVWMMAPELKAIHGPVRGREIRDELHDTKPTLWHRHYWDMAFYTVLNWERVGAGTPHWRAVERRCKPHMHGWASTR